MFLTVMATGHQQTIHIFVNYSFSMKRVFQLCAENWTHIHTPNRTMELCQFDNSLQFFFMLFDVFLLLFRVFFSLQHPLSPVNVCVMVSWIAMHVMPSTTQPIHKKKILYFTIRVKYHQSHGNNEWVDCECRIHHLTLWNTHLKTTDLNSWTWFYLKNFIIFTFAILSMFCQRIFFLLVHVYIVLIQLTFLLFSWVCVLCIVLSKRFCCSFCLKHHFYAHHRPRTKFTTNKSNKKHFMDFHVSLYQRVSIHTSKYFVTKMCDAVQQEIGRLSGLFTHAIRIYSVASIESSEIW